MPPIGVSVSKPPLREHLKAAGAFCCFFIGLLLVEWVSEMPNQNALAAREVGVIHTIEQLGQQFRARPELGRKDRNESERTRQFLAGLHGSQIYRAADGDRHALAVVRAIEKVVPGLAEVSAAYLGPEVERLA